MIGEIGLHKSIPDTSKVLDDKDVTTLYYNISKKEYDVQALLDYE